MKHFSTARWSATCLSIARWTRYSIILLLSLLAALTTLSCQSRLPGPLDCERMATRGIGGALKEIRGSALADNVLIVVTQSCITTPFDHESLRCVEAGYGLRRCTDELAMREPSRKKALGDMIHRIGQLDRHGRVLKKSR